MEHPKRKRRQAVAELEEDPKEALEILGNVLLETLQEQDESKMEVFELYTHALRTKIQIKHRDFSNSLKKGYEALILELRRQPT